MADKTTISIVLIVSIFCLSMAEGRFLNRKEQRRNCTATDVSIYEHEGHISCRQERCWEVGLVNPFVKKTYNLKTQTVTCWISGEERGIYCFENGHAGLMVETVAQEVLENWCFIPVSKAKGLSKVYLPNDADVFKTYFMADKRNTSLAYDCDPGYKPKEQFMTDPTHPELACVRRTSSTPGVFTWTWQEGVYACWMNGNPPRIEYRRKTLTVNSEVFCGQMDENEKLDNFPNNNERRMLLYDRRSDMCSSLLDKHPGAEIFIANKKIMEPCLITNAPFFWKNATISAGSAFRYKDCTTDDDGEEGWDSTCPCDCVGDPDPKTFGRSAVYISSGEVCTKYYVCGDGGSINKGIKVCYGLEKEVHIIATCDNVTEKCKTVPDEGGGEGGYWNPKTMSWKCMSGIQPSGDISCDENGRWTYPVCENPSCEDTVKHWQEEDIHLYNITRAAPDAWVATVKEEELCGEGGHFSNTGNEASCVDEGDERGRWRIPTCCPPPPMDEKKSNYGMTVGAPVTGICGYPMPLYGETVLDAEGCVMGCVDKNLFFPVWRSDHETSARCIYTGCALNLTAMAQLCGDGRLCEVVMDEYGMVSINQHVTVGWNDTMVPPRLVVVSKNGTISVFSFETHWYLAYRRLITADGKYIYHVTVDVQLSPGWLFPKLIMPEDHPLYDPNAPLIPCGVSGSKAVITGDTFHVVRTIMCENAAVEVACDGWTHFEFLNRAVDPAKEDETEIVPLACVYWKKKTSDELCNSEGNVDNVEQQQPQQSDDDDEGGGGCGGDPLCPCNCDECCSCLAPTPTTTPQPPTSPRYLSTQLPSTSTQKAENDFPVGCDACDAICGESLTAWVDYCDERTSTSAQSAICLDSVSLTCQAAACDNC